ncbi:MAG: hypothetical protein KBC46_03450 [Ferrovibrio sp.]|nr:hypothetical protein [Ferrovibrio sp.]
MPGETAGFDDTKAADLVRQGIAVYAKDEDGPSEAAPAKQAEAAGAGQGDLAIPTQKPGFKLEQVADGWNVIDPDGKAVNAEPLSQAKAKKLLKERESAAPAKQAEAAGAGA